MEIRLLSKLNRGQRGQTLIIALIMLALGSIIIAVLLSQISSTLVQGTAIEKRTSQLYLADGGVKECIFWLNNPGSVTVATIPSVVNNYSSLQLTTSNGINYKSYITYLGLVSNNKTYKITSFAGPNIQNNANPATTQTGPYTEIATNVTMTSGTIGLFSDAITALSGNISLSSSSVVNSSPTTGNGNVVAIAGNVNVTGSSTVNGNATVSAGYSISTSSSGTITGNSTVSGGALTPQSPLNTSIYKTQAQAAQTAINGTPSGSVTLNSSQTQTLTGPLNITGNITVSSSSHLTINGNVYVSGYVSVSSSSTLTINGGLYVNNGSNNNPAVNNSSSAQLTVNGPLYANGNFTSDSSSNFTPGGTTYVNGSISMGSSNGVTGQYPIVANGNINLTSSSSVSLSNTPLIISETGNITAASNVTVYGYLYAPNGNVNLSSSVKVYGSVTALTITASSSVGVYYDTSGLNGLPNSNGTGSANVNAWDVTTS